MKRRYVWLGLALVASGIAFAQPKGATKNSTRSSTISIEAAKAKKATPPKTKATARPSPRRTPTATARPKTATAKTPAAKTSAAKTPAPKAPPTYPADAYLLARFFPKKIDALTFVITPHQKRQYQLDGARRKTELLAGALNKFSAQLLSRSQSYGNSLRALIILQKVNSEPVWVGPSVSLPHLIAVRSHLRAQAQLLEMGLQIHGALREEANRAAEEYTQLEKEGASTDASVSDPFAITESVLERTRWENEALLRQRSLSPDAEQLLNAVRRIMPQEELHRLADFAPPSPGGEIRYDSFISPDTPLPEERISRTRPMPPDARPTPLKLPGIQLPVRAGARVLAPENGTVIFSDRTAGQGTVVIIAHGGGLYSVFANLDDSLVTNGGSVARNAAIGISPAEVPVYFEVRRDGKPVPSQQLLSNRTAESLLAP